MSADDKVMICTECARDKDLKALIKDCGIVIDTCKICGERNTKALDCCDEKLENLFRALLRYYYSEWDYNPHWGGEGFLTLLSKHNPITAYAHTWDEESYDKALQYLTDSSYNNIWLYGEGPLDAIKNEYSFDLKSLEQELTKVNFFKLEDRILELLTPHYNHFERYIDFGELRYRARIGYDDKMRSKDGLYGSWHYKPFTDKKLSAPPPTIASSGRLNRQGVSYLYLATDKKTAISEVKPHPGNIVSVGVFRSSKKFKIADFTQISIRNFCESEERLFQIVLLKDIEHRFSLPVPPDNRDKFSFTQFLAEALRHLGFDGIGYKSSVGGGSNLVVFDPSNFSYEQNSAEVVEITRLTYDCSALTVFDPKKYSYN